MARSPRASALLRQRFLQGLSYNDLLSAATDRRETLAAATAALITAGLFVSPLLALKYLMTPFLTPARTAVAMLDDMFLFAGWSFAVLALAGVAAWDSIGLDARDAAILGPLPVHRRDIVVAKLSALAVLAAALSLALNALPSLIYPSLVATALGAGVLDATRMIAAHLVSTVAAGWLGFAGVVAVREVTRALGGETVFRRIGTLVQGALLVSVGVLFLVLPSQSSRIANTWLEPSAQARTVMPPVWFVGLHGTVVGDAVVGIPLRDIPPWPMKFERAALPLYRRSVPVLHDLARLALAGLAAAVALGLVAYLWNTRRLSVAGPPVRASSLRTSTGWLARHVLARRQPARAGFFFTVQALTRCPPHRAALAMSAAAGLAVTVANADLRPTDDVTTVSLPFLVTQLVLLAALVVGFRHAVRLPADHRAGWNLQLAWTGDARPYISGAKRAAMLVLVVPALLLLLPLNVLVAGWSVALPHLAILFLVGCALLDVLMLGNRRVPFVSNYVPAENLKWVVPVGFFAFLLGATGFAAVERFALGSRDGQLILAAILFALVALFRIATWWHLRSPVSIDLDELPAPTTQRLNLEP